MLAHRCLLIVPRSSTAHAVRDGNGVIKVTSTLFALDTSLRSAHALEATRSENVAATTRQRQTALAFVARDSKWHCFMRQHRLLCLNNRTNNGP